MERYDLNRINRLAVVGCSCNHISLGHCDKAPAQIIADPNQSDGHISTTLRQIQQVIGFVPQILSVSLAVVGLSQTGTIDSDGAVIDSTACKQIVAGRIGIAHLTKSCNDNIGSFDISDSLKNNAQSTIVLLGAVSQVVTNTVNYSRDIVLGSLAGVDITRIGNHIKQRFVSRFCEYAGTYHAQQHGKCQQCTHKSFKLHKFIS